MTTTFMPAGSDAPTVALPLPRRRPAWLSAVPAAVGFAGLVFAYGAVSYAAAAGSLPVRAAITLLVFAGAVWLWIFTEINDTYISLAAALILVAAGAVPQQVFTGALGDEIIWLLIGSFIIAAAVTATGLAQRAAGWLLARARSPRQLVHLVTIALLLTTFAIPSTSGRAALALPVFAMLASVLVNRPRVVLCLALVFPAVILCSAVGSLLGAGAHLITAQLLAETTGADLGFVDWLLLGLPLAIVWSHLAAEVALWLFTDRTERRTPLSPVTAPQPAAGLTGPEIRILVILGIVVVGWCTDTWHGCDPALIALAGAIAATSPMIGAISLPAAVKTIPWALLLFLATTLVLGVALVDTGAAAWLADGVFAGAQGSGAATAFILVLAAVSLVSHLVIQSRSARSAVLVPMVIAAAPAVGVDPVAAAFLSTAAAGFCLTLTSSAKPVAMFAAGDGLPGYRSGHLLRLTAVLAPLSLALLLGFAYFIWPLFGLTLTV